MPETLARSTFKCLKAKSKHLYSHEAMDRMWVRSNELTVMKDSYQQFDKQLRRGNLSSMEHSWLRGELDRAKRDNAIQQTLKQIDMIERKIDRVITISEVWKPWVKEAEALRMLYGSLLEQQMWGRELYSTEAIDRM